MIEDMQHLTLFHAYQQEIQETVAHYNAKASGLTDKKELIEIYLAQNEALKEVLRKQNRAFRWMKGEKVEPEHHFVEAELVGKSNLTW